MLGSLSCSLGWLIGSIIPGPRAKPWEDIGKLGSNDTGTANIHPSCRGNQSLVYSRLQVIEALQCSGPLAKMEMELGRTGLCE